MKTEQLVLALVDGKQIEMDEAGRFWRLARRSRTGRLNLCPRVRAEALGKKGYYSVRANVGGVMCCARAHRLVWLLTRGPIPDDQQINHINGNKQDNRPENLELCTSGENTRHALRLGLAPRVNGERHPRAKLTSEQVCAIRTRRAAGEKLAALASVFGVTHQAIIAVCRKETWHHV